MLRSISTKTLNATFVEAKPYHLILLFTKRTVLLRHRIVPNVIISPQNPKTIWVTILLRSTALQNQALPSIVIFVVKNLQGVTIYVDIKTLNMAFKTANVDPDVIINEMHDTKVEEELRSGQLLFLVDSQFENPKHIFFIYEVGNLNETVVNKNLVQFFQHFKMCSEGESDFWFYSEECRRWKVPVILRTR